MITPSRSAVTLTSGLHGYTAVAMVRNTQDKKFEGMVTGYVEVITQQRAEPMPESYAEIFHMVKKNPLARMVLLAEEQKQELVSLNLQNLEMLEPVQVNDLSLSDAVGQKEPTYTGEAKIDEEIIDVQGLDLPTRVYESAEEAVKLENFPSHIKPFIKDIFVDKYPECVSLHALDAGNLSTTLGYCQLVVRDKEKLPRARRIFYISPTEERHLRDITDLLIKYGYISRTPIEPGGLHLYGMSSYLVPRAKEGSLGRLVIDYSPINDLIESPPSVIPEINATLQALYGKALFTSLDLRYAYLSVRITEDSKPLTNFLTPFGSFIWNSLPTGMSNSPVLYAHFAEKMIHEVPIKKQNGEVERDESGRVKMKKEPLEFVVNFFDDIMITSEVCSTYEETVRKHFKNVETLISRLAFHGGKLNIQKCEFGKSKILFLGWIITNNHVIADPRRIEKVTKFEFPADRKGIRSFLGLVNSLRRVLQLEVIEQVAILNPLTSSHVPFKPTDEHRRAFDYLKNMLTQAPLYSNLIDPQAPKYLWVDASTSPGTIGAVLAQQTKGASTEKVVPACIDLDDPVHQYIFDNSLPYEPVEVLNQMPTEKYKKEQPSKPPNVKKTEALLGYTEETAPDSLFWSIIALLHASLCTLLTVGDLRKMAVKKVKSTQLGYKMRDFTFNLNTREYHQFMEQFQYWQGPVDSEYILIEALALALYRPFIIISTLERHKQKPCFTFNHQSTKPPFIFGVYKVGEKEIFKPFMLNRNVVFNLDALKNKIEIIAYVSKSVPAGFENRSILDLESFAILTSLYSLQRYISGVPVTLLTDSKALFYLFSNKIHNSSVKIKRWVLKILADYPQAFVGSTSVMMTSAPIPLARSATPFPQNPKPATTNTFPPRS